MKDAKTQEKLAAASGREERIALAKERESGIIHSNIRSKRRSLLNLNLSLFSEKDIEKQSSTSLKKRYTKLSKKN